ncbi:MAG: alpha/beta hydrolase-fold protein [Steroidobacteraceae bacterium]|nr:alpha/beta hydrolase-fold protein [Steroidobacteraceae bacterium]
MTLAQPLRELLAHGTPSPEAIDGFLASHAFPLLDPHGVTFVFRGRVDAVVLRMFISGLPAAQPLSRAGDTDLWLLRLDLPEGSRFEYKFEVVRGHASEWITDPLNPHRASDPFGANSVCQGWGYQPPEWTRHDPSARPGTLDGLAVDSRHLGRRELRVYVPARFRRSRRYALLVCHDGEDYLRYAGLQTVLDNLIHRLEIPPLIVALTNSPDRLKEYVGFDPHADFVAHDLLPALAARFPLEDEPASRALMGASLGGVAALHAAWRHPGTFGRLLLQSGSFAFTDIGENRRGPVFEPVVKFVNAFRANPARPTERIYQSCGIYESLIYENRSLLPLLQDQKIQVRYDEARDGHNWQNWRDRLQAGLNYLFPGPLWMVYE